MAVNTWIKSSGAFDELADFDKILRDPNHLNRIAPKLAYNSSHPNDLGYEMIANKAEALIG